MAAYYFANSTEPSWSLSMMLLRSCQLNPGSWSDAVLVAKRPGEKLKPWLVWKREYIIGLEKDGKTCTEAECKEIWGKMTQAERKPYETIASTNATNSKNAAKEARDAARKDGEGS
ncbi:hypothetical protein D9758_018143 [Tetrapyrgos nigripes]|uniref:Uncharacterized protein n=1 Tax=Tetrapyrgos nigripes TaxID=182062 RepID=A0A8H5BCA4_9AGAR|nr:hypothetical protein D9758_018143 [Tetrapyrgos nigripes]